MAKLLKVVKVLRNNWKKSIFFFSLASYGVDYGIGKYNSFQLMREYCKNALQYGELPVPPGSRPRQITVILNPAANRRKCKQNFEKYCGPLLHLAGVSVNIVQTESEGQARSLVENLEGAVDAIVVAGGDGTLSETVTGLLRRSDGDHLAVQRKFPIGVLPLGRTNTVASSLFSGGESDTVKLMAEATMAVIREITKPIDVVKVEVLQTENEAVAKPVYCLAGIRWGAYRDAEAKKDKYWYWGTLRSYAAYLFMGMKGEKAGMTWQCEGELDYVLPCDGCNKCRQPVQVDNKSSSRWWHAFLPRQNQAPVEKDYSNVVNEHCGEMFQKDVSTVDLSITTANICPNCFHEGNPCLDVGIGPTSVGYTDFVSEGWRRLKGENATVEETINVREFNLKPMLKEGEEEKKVEQWISIDNEDFEVKPIHATLLPRKIHVFCPPLESLT